ncbi:hypothetical protein B0H10DRAFT_1961535 [Mycena sp. CBHHK59/15]|nr:hypothetical protein B0H10DRAFT_1961535 [Mycena sp. CBHHK59/15]
MRQTQAALCGRVQFPKRYQRVARRTGHVRYRARRAGTHGAGRGQHECEKGWRRVQLSAWWKIARASRGRRELVQFDSDLFSSPDLKVALRHRSAAIPHARSIRMTPEKHIQIRLRRPIRSARLAHHTARARSRTRGQIQKAKALWYCITRGVQPMLVGVLGMDKIRSGYIPPVPPNIRNHQGRKASGGGVYTIQPPDCGQRYAVYAHGGPGWDDLLLEWLWTVITREARWNAN